MIDEFSNCRETLKPWGDKKRSIRKWFQVQDCVTWSGLTNTTGLGKKNTSQRCSKSNLSQNESPPVTSWHLLQKWLPKKKRFIISFTIKKKKKELSMYLQTIIKFIDYKLFPPLDKRKKKFFCFSSAIYFPSTFGGDKCEILDNWIWDPNQGNIIRQILNRSTCNQWSGKCLSQNKPIWQYEIVKFRCANARK